MISIKKIIVTIITATIIITLPRISIAKTIKEIVSIAKQVTVKIIQTNSNNNGSGVIFARQDNIYSVLTNQHVVTPGEEYQILTADDNKKHKVISRQEILGLDLIVLHFESINNYKIANLGDSNEITPLQEIYVAGYRGKKTDLDLTKGDIININTEVLNNPESKQGYALEYDNLTLPGTSGGGIFNQQGDVIGINGQAERDIQSGRDISRGIPINLFFDVQDLIASPSAIEMGQNLLSINNSSSQETRFSCIKYNDIPTTVGGERGRPFISWSSNDYFGDFEYTAQKRCEVVSQRFEKTFQDGILKHLFIGKIVGYPAICTSDNKQNSKCNNENLLFILRPSDDANYILQTLIDARLHGVGISL